MKKIYTLIAGLLLTGSAVNAQIQIIKDGGFQGTYANGADFNAPSTNLGGFTANLTSLDWIGILNKEATAPITGTQSGLLVSVDDIAAVNFLFPPAAGSTNESKTSGIAQQLYQGGALAGKTPSNFTFSFKYKYAPVGVDTAFAIINIIDTNITGQAALLYQGLAIMVGQNATAATKTVTSWYTGGPGTANRAIITFGTSLSNYFDDVPAPIGSKLTLDDVSWTINSGVGIDEVTEASSNVYPNPVVNMLNVEITNAEATSISIYSLDGTLVKTEKLNGVKGAVNVENLNSGMYLYTISTKGGAVITSKFLKN